MKNESIPELCVTELINYIKYSINSGDIKYIAQVKSTWQMLGALAAIEDLYSGEPGIMVIQPWGSDYLLDLQDFDYDGVNISKCKFIKSTTEFSDISSKKKIKNGVQTMFGFLRPIFDDNNETIGIIVARHRYNMYARLFADISISSDYRPQYISIDNGIGGYPEYPSEVIPGGRKPFTHQMIRYAYDKCINVSKFLYFNYVPHINRLLFDIIDNKLAAREHIVEQYRSLLPSLKHQQENKIMFISQPFVESGLLSREEENKILTDFIFRNQNHNIIFRPHPKEDDKKFDKYEEYENIEVLSTNTPIEFEIPRIQPEAIFGYFSTALITIPVIYRIPAYSLSEKLSEVSENEFLRWKSDAILELGEKYISSVN